MIGSARPRRAVIGGTKVQAADEVRTGAVEHASVEFSNYKRCADKAFFVFFFPAGVPEVLPEPLARRISRRIHHRIRVAAPAGCQLNYKLGEFPTEVRPWAWGTDLF